MNRVLEITSFLEAHGWGDAAQTPMDADFSSRRYARLQHADGRQAILMDADKDQKTPQFVGVAKILRDLKIHAPEIYAADPMHGLVLMEDFGAQNVGKLIDEYREKNPLIPSYPRKRVSHLVSGGPTENGMPAYAGMTTEGGMYTSEEYAKSFYTDAARLLAHLHRGFDCAMVDNADLPIFNSRLLVEQVELYLNAYFPSVRGREATADERADFCADWLMILRPLDAMPQSLMLRDFMPDNLMLLSFGDDWQRLGVLDFQDAGIGPIAYDLASLCEVVRRDGGDAMLDDVLHIYHAEAQPKIGFDDFKRAAIILSAQRHMRILGIIAQLLQRGRNEKLTVIPRVKNNLARLLQHDTLKPIKAWLV